MSVTTRAFRYLFIVMGSGLAAEIVVVYTAIHFEKIAVLFVVGPLLLLLAVLLFMNKVTGIRCPKCNNIYGVSIGSRGFPYVPTKCLSCGHAAAQGNHDKNV